MTQGGARAFVLGTSDKHRECREVHGAIRYGNVEEMEFFLTCCNLFFRLRIAVQNNFGSRFGNVHETFPGSEVSRNFSGRRVKGKLHRAKIIFQMDL